MEPLVLETDRQLTEDVRLALFRGIFAESTDGIAVIDTDGMYLEQNPAHAALTGCSDEELVGQTPAIHLGETAFRQIVESLRRTGRYHGEHEGRTRDGTLRTIELSAFEVRDENGDVACYVTIGRDITQRQLAESALQRRDRQLQALHRLTAEVSRATSLSTIQETALDCLEDALDCDGAALLLFENNRALRVKAWRYLTPSFRHALENDPAWQSTEPLHHAFGITDVRGAPAFRELRPLLEDEGIRAVAFVPLIAQEQVLGRFLLFFEQPHTFSPDEMQLAQTIASQIAFSIARQRTEDELKKANASKSAFLAMMSHELRTPLNAILGYVELLKLGIGGQLTDRQRAHVQCIEASSRHLMNVIEDILTFSRAEAGREVVQYETFELAEFIAETAAMVEPAARQKDLRFNVRIPAQADPVFCDRNKLRQILLNLLSNAIKFTDHGQVSLDVEHRDGTLRIAVADTGPGIPPEHHQRIFEPFWQADPGSSHHAGGTGLGLAVTRQLVELLQGRVRLESRPGRGTRFTVELPARPPEAAPAEALTAARANAPA